MNLDQILVLAAGSLAIAFVYWFFLMKKEETVVAHGEIDILVEGGYTPSVISLAQGQSTTINFLRKDPSSCLEEVTVPEFKLKKYLPLNEKVSISINPKQKGEFAFSCGMNMYHGKIIVL
ncbi:MAG: cupredoxin domain-containing protein [Candidatus Doudnabacteria bacterium]|nr:cupredoxin domain-containing protein [Candidatus Doudnabacteria bacterium]